LERRLEGLYEYERVPERKAPPEERLSFEEISRGYSEEEARLEALRCMQCQDPPCVAACPAHLNVPGYAKAIVEGDYKRGLQIIMDTYPLPGTCGRVCFHPCTDVCLRGVRGTPLNIPRLRRFLADTVSQYDLDYNLPPPTGKKVAVIGSGPAGLACAYHLRRRGHEVTVFEKDERPGGTLNILPDYRLPKGVIQSEIEVLKWLGIEIRTNSPIGGEGCLDELLEEYDAVFIGAGAVGSSKPRLDGVDLPSSVTGLEYLRAVQRGEAPQVRRAAIIGGGDVAMDCLRTAIRTSEVVHWIYRRSPLEMPGSEDELIELGEEVTLRDMEAVERAFVHPYKLNVLRRARRELLKLTFEERRRLQQDLGRKLKAQVIEDLSQSDRKLVVQLLTNPTRVLGKERVEGLELVRMKLSEPDESGRRRPVPIEGSEFTVPMDLVIFAIGQNVESDWLGENSGVELSKWGEIIVDPKTQKTSRERVFAGGDAVRGPASMIDALADGIRAAGAIDELLRQPSS